MSKPKKVGWAGASQKARSTVRVFSRVRVSRRERFVDLVPCFDFGADIAKGWRQGQHGW